MLNGKVPISRLTCTSRTALWSLQEWRRTILAGFAAGGGFPAHKMELTKNLRYATLPFWFQTWWKTLGRWGTCLMTLHTQACVGMLHALQDLERNFQLPEKGLQCTIQGGFSIEICSSRWWSCHSLKRILTWFLHPREGSRCLRLLTKGFWLWHTESFHPMFHIVGEQDTLSR